MWCDIISFYVSPFDNPLSLYITFSPFASMSLVHCIQTQTRACSLIFDALVACALELNARVWVFQLANETTHNGVCACVNIVSSQCIFGLSSNYSTSSRTRYKSKADTQVEVSLPHLPYWANIIKLNRLCCHYYNCSIVSQLDTWRRPDANQQQQCARFILLAPHQIARTCCRPPSASESLASQPVGALERERKRPHTE